MGRPSISATAWAARQSAVAAIAVQMFDRDGFDSVSVADVAAAAGVSIRTVQRLFPSKDDMVLHASRPDADGFERIVRVSRASPKEALFEGLRWLVEQADNRDGDGLRAMRLLHGTDGLWARSLDRYDRWSERIVHHLVRDGVSELQARVLTAAMLSCWHTVVRSWVLSRAMGGTRPLRDLFDEATQQLR